MISLGRDFETQWTFQTQHFLVEFAIAPETLDPADSFEFEDDIAAVRNGDVDWFQAGVGVYLLDDNGERIALVGSDYLGGCAYKSASEFIESHWRSPTERRNTLALKAKNTVICDYFPDMVRTAIRNARETLCRTPKLRCA